MKQSDEWQTSQWLYDELNAEFNFDIDLCATKENSKCNTFCYDYLNNVVGNLAHNQRNRLDDECWSKHLRFKKAAFMNPPYSNPRPFVEKAFKDAKENKITIVCLLKCDPSTRWWAVFWDYGGTSPHCDSQWCDEWYRGPKPGVEVRFLPKRVKFEHPDYCTEYHGPNKDTIYCLEHNKLVSNGPTFPSCAVIFRGEEM